MFSSKVHEEKIGCSFAPSSKKRTVMFYFSRSSSDVYIVSTALYSSDISLVSSKKLLYFDAGT